MEGPRCKRARYMSSWEFSAFNKTTFSTSSPGFRLVNLFGRRRPNHDNRRENGRRFRQDSESFTLRMEHHEGGMVAKHPGEERILIFRSDQRGAIAKIIFSSSPTDKILDESDYRTTAQAYVHSLHVKEPYRGYDLGGLLFSEAMASLRERYVNAERVTNEVGEGKDAIRTRQSSVRCQLDAEEEVDRHNKLVGFYEQLGCHVRPKAKIIYIPNNDGETYRKVPMQIQLRPDPERSSHQKEGGKHRLEYGSLVGRSKGFLPVVLLEGAGKRVYSSSKGHTGGGRVDWLVVETGEGFLEFRTTKGSTLMVAPDGQCIAACHDAADEAMWDKTCSKFQLLRVSDAQQRILEFEDNLDDESTPEEARKNELWMFQSIYGTFLNIDPQSHNLQCSNAPAFWQADDGALSLTCTSDTPARRQHYRRMWTKQTLEYVTMLKERYLGFNLRRMTLKNALDLTKSVSGVPFAVERSPLRVSLRTLSFRSAEIARSAGHADWVQFIALIHGLGSVVNCIDIKTAAESEDDYDWTICSHSRVVGCAAPNDVTFSEFRGLNSDEHDERYRSPLGMYNLRCGLMNAVLTWTGPEYMYHMLKHNRVDIPEEGLSMLRLFSLFDWHTKGHYEVLADDDDLDVRPFVTDFDELRQSALQSHQILELSDEECDALWDSHYAHVVGKYGADGMLMW